MMRTRRSFLKSAAVLSAAPFIRQPARATMSRGIDTNDSSLGELNVVFHGVFVFMYDQKDPGALTVYVPAVAGHVYQAGNWEQEDENDLTQHQSYELKGKFSHSPCPPPTEDETAYPVIDCKNRPDASKLICTIRLPMPQKIVGLRCLHKQSGFGDFFKNSYAPKSLHFLPLAYALVYSYDAKEARPYLEGTSWKAPHRPGPVNLHVRAESPDAPPQASHDGFRAILGLLGYTTNDLDINPQYGDCEVGPDLTPGLKGLHGLKSAEEYFLAEMFPNHPTHLPGSPQQCRLTYKLQPANCSSLTGVQY